MKFGHVFKEALRNEGFPSEWIDSAISYSQLKKCINRLTAELAQVGLDPATLSKLLKHVESYNASTGEVDDEERPFEYILSDGDAASNGKKREQFQPKLLFYVDEATGLLHRAQLAAETKRKLQMLAVETGMTELKVFEEPDNDSLVSFESTESAPSTNGATTVNGHKKRTNYRTVEVPLTSDTEFFTKLSSELSGLEALQEREEKRMHGEIEELGKQIAKLTDPDRRANRKLLAVWRQIFQMYLEEGIFFGATESDHSAHDAEMAAARYQDFCSKIAQAGLVDKIKKKENVQALSTFMQINREILQGLRFGEMNHTAMLKILKKFDKRTSLNVRTTLPSTLPNPSFSTHLAKAVCASVSTEILSHVPQLDDYSCPMCFDIKWRPVTLACAHSFCIRCLIVMQTNGQDCCPLCRKVTVKDANSENLDLEMAGFLKKWFPEEVRLKQKYNERMAGVDQYGEVYAERCCVM